MNPHPASCHTKCNLLNHLSTSLPMSLLVSCNSSYFFDFVKILHLRYLENLIYEKKKSYQIIFNKFCQNISTDLLYRSPKVVSAYGNSCTVISVSFTSYGIRSVALLILCLYTHSKCKAATRIMKSSAIPRQSERSCLNCVRLMFLKCETKNSTWTEIYPNIPHQPTSNCEPSTYDHVRPITLQKISLVKVSLCVVKYFRPDFSY